MKLHHFTQIISELSSSIDCIENSEVALMGELDVLIIYTIPTIKSINFWNTSFTRLAVSVTSSWLSFTGNTPAAIFVTQLTPTTCMPQCPATIASGTVDMPTVSAPIMRNMRISAGVS